jgi:hypothetical protein
MTDQVYLEKRTVYGAQQISKHMSEIQQIMQVVVFWLSLIWQGFGGDFRFKPTKKADSLWCAPMSGNIPDFPRFLTACQEI